MKARSFDPHRLDVEAFARDAGELDGSWSLAELPRLRDAQMAESDAAPQVPWSVRGERVQERAGEGEIWLHLQASTTLQLQCQRCLQPVEVPMQLDRGVRIVRGEDEAAALDADIDDDVLALTRSLDLRELIEDELLLALPLVPHHDVCPQPLPLPEEAAFEDDEPHPFAALAALKAKLPRG